MTPGPEVSGWIMPGSGGGWHGRWVHDDQPPLIARCPDICPPRLRPLQKTPIAVMVVVLGLDYDYNLGLELDYG